MPVPRLAELLGVPVPDGVRSDAVVSGVTLDSRTVRPGDLYAALPGARTHGAHFVAQALASGAAAVLTDPVGADIGEAALDVPVLVVAEPRAALGAVAATVYGTTAPGLALVGITGTNGKTTTSYLLAGALSAIGRSVGLIGTVEIRVGDRRVPSVRTTPESPDLHALLACMREAGDDVCVMEVSSHALALHRVDGLHYDVAVFTNLSQDHLDLHGNMTDYFAAKAMLFTPGRSRRGVICVVDEWGARLAREADIPVVTLATRPEVPADYAITINLDGTFRLRGLDLDVTLRSALPGDFNRTNTALAALVLHALGVEAAQITTAIAADPHVPGRMERVSAPDPRPQDPLGVVDYAHTPDAVEAALAALRPHAPGGLVVVLGAGGDRDRGKRAAMGAAAARAADVVVVTDDNPRGEDPALIRRAVRAGAEAAGGGAVVEIGDRREAIRAAVAAARARGAGTIVAVVGKGHESGQEVAGVTQPFDDRAELAAALT